MTSPSTCRACLRDQHHRCVGWCGCPFAHKTTTTPAPKAKTARTPAKPRAPRATPAAASKPAPTPAPAAPPKRFKPRHRREPVARPVTDPTTRRETALAFLDDNAWSPAALQLLAAIDGHGIDSENPTETAA
jgi:hypothetical protein